MDEICTSSQKHMLGPLRVKITSIPCSNVSIYEFVGSKMAHVKKTTLTKIIAGNNDMCERWTLCAFGVKMSRKTTVESNKLLLSTNNKYHNLYPPCKIFNTP